MAKILMLANNDIGLYKCRKELIQELINQGNEIYISLPWGEFVQPLTEIGCAFFDTDINRRGMNPISDLMLFAKYLKIIKKIKPNMVITYTIKPNIYGGLACRLKRVPCAINITGLGTAFQKDGFLKKFIILLYKFACKKAKVVFFENEDNQSSFVDLKIVRKDKTCKLNGAGVNLTAYQFCDYPDDAGGIRFLFIGRVMKEKGIDELVKAAVRIRSEYQNVHIDIIGPKEEAYYIKKIDSLQKQGIVNYYGYQKDVRSFIKRSHCFVLPSYHEGMANTLLECGAMGRPLITSDIPGCREAVLDRVNGFLVKVKDSDELYKKMKLFIELTSDERRIMGKKSSEHIESIFDKNIVVHKTLKELATNV